MPGGAPRRGGAGVAETAAACQQGAVQPVAAIGGAANGNTRREQSGGVGRNRQRSAKRGGLECRGECRR